MEQKYRCPICPTRQLEYHTNVGLPYTGGSLHYFSCGHQIGLSSGFEIDYYYDKYKDKFDFNKKLTENYFLTIITKQYINRPDWPIDGIVIRASEALESNIFTEEQKNFIKSHPWFDGSFRPRERLDCGIKESFDGIDYTEVDRKLEEATKYIKENMLKKEVDNDCIKTD